MEPLDRGGMVDCADILLQLLSCGQQQSIGVAGACAREPDLLLLGEALSSLGVDVRERLHMEIPNLLRETGAAPIAQEHMLIYPECKDP